MKKQKVTLHSPIAAIVWPPRILALFEGSGIKVIFDIYRREVRAHKKTAAYVGGGLGQIEGFGKAAYRDTRRLLQEFRLPDLGRAPRIVSQSDAIQAHTQNEGSSSG